MTFDIDADGILHVSAKDMASGKEQKIRIEVSSGLSEDEIERMVKDAEDHKEEDRARKEKAEVRNEADSLAFRAEKALEDYKDQVPAEVASAIQTKVDALKKALEGEDLAAIRVAKEDLEKEMQKIGEAMAQAQQAAGAAAAQSEAQPESAEASASSDDNIEDAEIVDDKS